MNEEQFLRKINSRQNAYGDLSFDIVKEFLEQKERALNRSNKIMNKLFQLFSTNEKHKTPEQIIEENFETILNSTSDASVGKILNFLLDDAETRNIVIGNLDKVLERFKISKSNDRFIINNELAYQRAKIIERISKLPEGHSILAKNIDTILVDADAGFLFDIMKSIKGISDQSDNRINEYLKKHKNKLIRAMVYKNARNFSNHYEKLYTNCINNDRRIIKK